MILMAEFQILIERNTSSFRFQQSVSSINCFSLILPLLLRIYTETAMLIFF